MSHLYRYTNRRKEESRAVFCLSRFCNIFGVLQEGGVVVKIEFYLYVKYGDLALREGVN